ncbi:hypothetical protein C8J56DRAFT_1165827 [Mycena floridula]|nr:hypothetical protein C8J56DRAFT_1165827 [Mycena floridula]
MSGGSMSDIDLEGIDMVLANSTYPMANSLTYSMANDSTYSVDNSTHSMAHRIRMRASLPSQPLVVSKKSSPTAIQPIFIVDLEDSRPDSGMWDGTGTYSRPDSGMWDDERDCGAATVLQSRIALGPYKKAIEKTGSILCSSAVESELNGFSLNERADIPEEDAEESD